MRKILLLGLMFLFFTPTCKTESKPVPTQEKEFEQTNIIVPQHNILNEDIYDVPIKTQITLEILVQDDTTEQGLRDLINHLYSNFKKRTGFKYHSSPTNIYIYLYATKEKHEAGTEYWIMMLDKSFDDITPKICYPNPLRYFYDLQRNK